jgi:hypothetical protein
MGLKDLDAAPDREALYRTRSEVQAAAGGPIRLGQYQRDVMACRAQSRQRSLGELWRTSKD